MYDIMCIAYNISYIHMYMYNKVNLPQHWNSVLYKMDNNKSSFFGLVDGVGRL